MRLIHYFNMLSIDVAVGAMVGSAFFAKIFGVHLLPHALISLGLIVWIIYTIDHLVDAHHSEGTPATARHRFHRHNARWLQVAVILATIIVGMEAFFVRKPVLVAGLGVAVLVVGYLLVQASLRFFKEVVGAMLYTAGVVAAPFSLLSRPLTRIEIGLIALLMLTAYINLLLFSLFDFETDKQDKHNSFATAFGKNVTSILLVAAFVLAFILCSVLISSYPTYSTAVSALGAMNAFLLVTFLYRGYFAVNDRYRRLGDAVFLFPLVILILA
jgi:hypothetical protein